MIKRKVASAVAAAALLLNASSGVIYAGVSCTISGNGSDTENNCDFTSLNEVGVEQTNDMDVHNDVYVNGNTGNNEAEDNTGGDVSIETGDVEANVTVNTSGNTNSRCPPD